MGHGEVACRSPWTLDYCRIGSAADVTGTGATAIPALHGNGRPIRVPAGSANSNKPTSCTRMTSNPARRRRTPRTKSWSKFSSASSRIITEAEHRTASIYSQLDSVCLQECPLSRPQRAASPPHSARVLFSASCTRSWPGPASCWRRRRGRSCSCRRGAPRRRSAGPCRSDPAA